MYLLQRELSFDLNSKTFLIESALNAMAITIGSKTSLFFNYTAKFPLYDCIKTLQLPKSSQTNSVTNKNSYDFYLKWHFCMICSGGFRSVGVVHVHHSILEKMD